MKYPYLFKNFFTEDEMSDLKFHIDNLVKNSKRVEIKNLTWDQIYGTVTALIIDKHFGRVQLTLPSEKYPNNIVNKLIDAAKTLDPNCKIKYLSYARYSPAYGRPQLTPHMDNPKKESFLFDIQLNSNIQWPIMVDDKEYILEDNDILVMDVQRQTHWRKPTKFESDSYVEMLFVSFENEELELPIESEQKEVAKKYDDEYHKQMHKIYPNYVHSQRLPLK